MENFNKLNRRQQMMIEALVSNPNTPQAQLYEGLKIPARTYYD